MTDHDNFPNISVSKELEIFIDPSYAVFNQDKLLKKEEKMLISLFYKC
jgi:hypothetical protein